MIGILGAMEDEIALVSELLERPGRLAYGGRSFSQGRIGAHDAIVAISGFGKVAAASTVTTMIDRFGVTAVIFTGVAGGVGDGVSVGDLVVAKRLVQHDFDASPIFERFVIPSLGTASIASDPAITAALTAAATEVASNPPRQLEEFGIASIRSHTGVIASGDRFIDDPAEAAELTKAIKGLLAVEMEGAAVAQVCAERRVPFGVVRSISDRADATAPTDFLSFVSSVAAPLGAAVVVGALRRLSA